MRLIDYLWENRLTQKQFADMLGYSRNYINMLCKGHASAGPRIAKYITQLTNGKVTADDLKKKEVTENYDSFRRVVTQEEFAENILDR